MRNRLITVFVALAVLTAGQTTGPPFLSQSLAAAAHAHPVLPHHVCCPSAGYAPEAPLPVKAPLTDHRCCFLRGPVSTLPVAVAGGKKPMATSLLTAVAALHSSGNEHRVFGLFATSFPTPPHSLQMNVVLQN